MPKLIDTRNQQHLFRGHAAMCCCKKHTHSPSSAVLSELSRISSDARDYCLDAPTMLPTGSVGGCGPFGTVQRYTLRP